MPGHKSLRQVLGKAIMRSHQFRYQFLVQGYQFLAQEPTWAVTRHCSLRIYRRDGDVLGCGAGNVPVEELPLAKIPLTKILWTFDGRCFWGWLRRFAFGIVKHWKMNTSTTEWKWWPCSWCNGRGGTGVPPNPNVEPPAAGTVIGAAGDGWPNENARAAAGAFPDLRETIDCMTVPDWFVADPYLSALCAIPNTGTT